MFYHKFPYLYRYFLFLVFLQYCYLLVSSHPSQLRRTPIFYPIFILSVPQILRRTCAHILLAHIMRFLEVRRSWKPSIKIITGIISLFCFFPKVSCTNVHWAIANHTFSSHLNPQTDTFLRDISLHYINAVQLGKGILKGFPIIE